MSKPAQQAPEPAVERTSRNGRLPPSDIQDLRYLFCQMSADAGVKSVQGGMVDIVARRARSMKEPKGKKAERAWRPRRGKSTSGDRSSAACIQDALDGGGSARAPRGVEVDVVILAPAVPASEMKAARRPPDIAPGSPAGNVHVGGGRSVRAYDGVGVRKMPPAGGEARWMIKCSDRDDSDGGSHLNGLELWSEWGHPRATWHARGWRCRDTLARLEREPMGALYVVVLHLAYGYKSPSARYDLWEAELAPLVTHTPTVERMRREAASLAVQRRHGRGSPADDSPELRQAELQTRPEDVLREALTVHATGNSDAARLARATRAALIDQLREEAEALLIAASAAYRRVRVGG